MCGIVGIADLDRPVDPRIAYRMAEAVAHRGPDGEGYWHADHVAFGFRRLAIVDVERGYQPTHNEDRSVSIVFNGEIYNHRALRQALASRGHSFWSGCDAEVIPHLYEERGLGFVDHLDGDFAIALWDARRQALVLARDRVGVKPLFYHHQGSRLIFASEVKGILASRLCEVAIDRQGLSDCLQYGQPVAPNTFWVGVRDLPPGTTLTLSGEGLSEQRYYSPLRRTDPDRPLLSGSAAVEAFRDRLTDAVRKRLPDEVRAGCCLSGGLDSTAVAAVAARRCDAPLPTWSIRLPGESLDEGTFSRYAAKELGLANEEIPVTGREASAWLPATLWHLETPQWFGVAPPFYGLSKRGREAGIKVALTGDGADELLGGYDFYRLNEINRRLTSWHLGWLQPALWRRAVQWIHAPEGIVDHMLRVHADEGRYRRRFGELPAWLYVWSGASSAAASLLDPDALPPPSPLPAPPPHTPFHRSLYFEYVTRLPNWVLLMSDRLSMAHGVEVRVPFMDRYLLDLSAELDPHMLLHFGTEKYVMKRALEKVAPSRVVSRRKKPFFTPVASWYLAGAGRQLADDYLSESHIRRVGLFDARATHALWKTALSRPGTWAGMTAEWTCMMVLSTHILAEQFSPSRLAQSEVAG